MSEREKKMKILQNRLDKGFQRYQKEFENKALQILRSGTYILGDEVRCFEEEFAHYMGAEYCVGLASGLDALWIALKLLGIGNGDEVIIQSNAYIASVMAITINGAVPVFVEPDSQYQIDIQKIEEKITDKTKAILVVHLYGQAARIADIKEICKEHNLMLVEDCAQSHGAEVKGKKTGTYGEIGCFSFYPSKNIGAFGDGGAIITDDSQIAELVRIYRNYGSEKRYENKVVGANSRLDELQAGLLRIKLEHIDEIIEERRMLADRYSRELMCENIILPQNTCMEENVWHQYVIRCERRKELIEYLEKNDIQVLIHYPIPPHLSAAYKYLGYGKGSFPIAEKYADEVLSLPFYLGMTEDEQRRVINTLNKFV